MAISNSRCSFADFEVEINELDSNIPIMDMVTIPFGDLGDSGIDHIDIWNRTLRILLENNILEIENKDKFSAWWDLAQDANEGTTLYYLADDPEITLLKIFLEPIHRIIRSILEVKYFSGPFHHPYIFLVCERASIINGKTFETSQFRKKFSIFAWERIDRIFSK